MAVTQVLTFTPKRPDSHRSLNDWSREEQPLKLHTRLAATSLKQSSKAEGPFCSGCGIWPAQGEFTLTGTKQSVGLAIAGVAMGNAVYVDEVTTGRMLPRIF